MKKNQKKLPKQKLNYAQRVVATPLNLSANEIDRAHTSTYFIINTLATYQQNFLAREYRKFWYELTPQEAVKRIDEEMGKFGVNVLTRRIANSIILNIHFAIYVYENKKFLCPRMIVRDLSNKTRCYVDGGPILVAPHCFARMLSRSGLEFRGATKLLGGVLLQLMMAAGEERLPSFNQSINTVSEIGILNIGNLRCNRLVLSEDVLCDGSAIIPAGKSVLLLKTWLDEQTLPDDYYQNRKGGKLFRLGEEVQ